MIPTTPEYDAAAIANIRKPKGKLTVTWSDALIDTGITISNNGENNISDDLHTADTIIGSSYKWVLLDGLSLLDGTYSLAPSPHQTAYQVGWYGNKLSNASGEFSSPDPALTITFPAKPIYGVVVAFENTLSQYAINYTIDIKLGSTVLDVIFVIGNDKIYSHAVPNVEILSADSIVLTIEKWSQTGTMVKVLEFYSSIIREYTGDVIKSISVLEEREIRDSTNPIGNISSNEVNVELQNIKIDDLRDPFFPGNTDSIYSTLLKPGRRIDVELGFELADGTDKLLQMGTYWSGDFTIKDSSPTISFTGRDRMELLRKTIYDDNQINSDLSFQDLLTDLCISASAKIKQLNYFIDSDLDSLNIPLSFVNRINYFEAIKNIMAGCGGQAYMNRTDVLTFEAADKSIFYSGSADLFITKSEYFSKDQPQNYEDLINILEIETQPRTISASIEDVYDSESAITLLASVTLSPMELKYDNFPVSSPTITYSVESGSCNPSTASVEYRSWGCILTVTNTAAADGTFKIHIDGYTYSIKGTEVASVEDLTSTREHEKRTYRLPANDYIQTLNLAEDLAIDLIDYYKDPRNDLVLTWRGNPALELGDIIVVPEYQRGTIDNKARFKIYKLQTDFDGTLKQTISARRLDTYTP